MGVLGNIWVKLGLKSDDFRKGMDQSEQRVSKFSSFVQKHGKIIAAGFAVAVAAVGKMVLEMGKAAAAADGVKRAFSKIADNNTLKQLREATRGTVDDVVLMKKTIQASNFGIPIKELAGYFEFATTRAIDTGESVDYLVDSIITGLGRKSVMILDNLGLSAAEIRKEMDKSGDMAQAVGVIIQREMAKTGKSANTVSVTLQQVKATWDNVKVSFGSSQVIQGTLNAIGKGANELLKSLDNIRNAGGRKMFNATQEIDEYKNYIDATVGSGEFERRAAQVQEWYKKSLAEGGKIIDLNGNKISKKYAKVYFAALEKYLKDLTDTGEEAGSIMTDVAEEVVDENTTTEKSYNGLIGKIDETISALEEKKKAATNISEIAAINDEIAALSKLKESYEAVSAVMLEMGRTPLPKVDGSGKVTTPVTTKVPVNGVDIDALTKKYGKQKKEVQEIEKSFMRITDAVYRITYSGLELAEMFGLDPEIARALNGMVGSVLDIVDAMDAVTKATNSAADAIGDVGTSMGQTGSAVLAVFGAVLSINTAIIKIDMALQQAKMDERVARINSELLRVKHLVDDIGASMGGGWFVTDNFEKVKDLNAELTTLASHAAVAMKKWVNSFADTYTSSEDLRQSLKAFFGDVTDLANQLNSDAFASAFSGQMLGNIDALSDALKQMEILAQEGTDAEKAMAKAAIELLEQAIGTYDELRSTISAMVGDISGTLYNTVTVEWKKIWQENKEAGADSFAGIAEAAKKNIAQIMESIVTQQIWASVMAPVFDSFGIALTNAIAGGGDITRVFDDFFKGFDAQLEGYYGLLDKFYTGAEGKEWDFTEPEVSSGATSEEDALDKLVEKQKLLNDLHKQWIELYGQETADAMLAGMGADAESYVKALEDSIAELDALREAGTITDEQLQQLQNFQDQLLGIRDAAKEAAAEAEAEAKAASQAAYDAWSANMQAGLKGAEDEYEQLLAYEAAIKAAVEDTTMSEADRAEAIKQASDAQAELYNQIKSGLESTYATDDDKWAAQQEQYRKDIEWATANGLPELAKKIQDTWDAEVIKRSTDALNEWKGTIDEALSGVESGRIAAIVKMQEDYVAGVLAGGGMPSIERMRYFANLMEAEQKNLNKKYETEEDKHLKTLAEYDADYNDAKLLGDEELMAEILAQREEYNNDYIQQIKDNASAEAQALLEGSEEYKALIGDLAKLGVEESRKALDAYRKMVENSEDLSDEAKAEILAGLDEIQEKIDDIELDNLQQQFEDIQSVISSISSILGSFGASSELTEGLSGLSNVIGGLFSVISGGTWVDKFAGIASMIGGIVTVAKSLKGLFATGNEDLTGGVDALSAAYQKLVGIMNKAFGDHKASIQQQAIENIRAQIAEYQRLIREEESKTGFWDWLKGDLKDDSLIMQYTQAIENLNKELGRYDEEIKSDFLQTDTDSFVNELRDIWAQSYDSAEDYYKALENLNNKTIDNMIARWIEKKLVEDQVNTALNRLYDSGMTDSAFALFEMQIQGISASAKSEYERWKERGYFQEDQASGDSMSGSLARTATEAQFNQYLGYVQNLNITAHDILNALSDQPALIDFSALAQISRGIANDVERIKDNTEYCRMLESMKNDLAAIRRGSSVAYN